MLIVLPFCQKDEDQALRLAQWMAELGPYHNHSILLVMDQTCSHMQKVFLQPHTFSRVDILKVNDAPEGWPMGPNHMFQKTARYCEQEPFLWLEPDAVPMRKGWLDEIDAEYKIALQNKKVIMGAFVPAFGDAPDHCSGIAVYPPLMQAHAGRVFFATDSPWDLYAADQIVPRTHFTSLIKHTWKRHSFISQEEVDALGDCAIFHASKDGSAVRLLRERLFSASMKVKINGGKCKVDGCDKPAQARGECRMHYARFDNHGSYDLPEVVRSTVQEQLETKRAVSDSGCWLWTGSSGSSGYGQIYSEDADGPRGVHRVSYEHYVGPIPEGMHICHKCDVKICFNPEHLFPGDDTTNMRDAADKGRLPHGENHVFAKLTDAEVACIRNDFEGGGVTHQDLAVKYNCSAGNIRLIVMGKTRKHPTGTLKETDVRLPDAITAIADACKSDGFAKARVIRQLIRAGVITRQPQEKKRRMKRRKIK